MTVLEFRCECHLYLGSMRDPAVKLLRRNIAKSYFMPHIVLKWDDKYRNLRLLRLFPSVIDRNITGSCCALEDIELSTSGKSISYTAANVHEKLYTSRAS